MNAGAQTETAVRERPGATAELFMAAASPRSPDIHLFESDDNFHLFVTNGSRLFDINPDLASRFGAAISAGGGGGLLAPVGAGGPRRVEDRPLLAPPIPGLSLAGAAEGNLGVADCD